MHLITSIYSYMQPGWCYGRQGDSVTVIAVHHSVAIVEDLNKKRFPVPVESLSEAPVIKSATQPVQVSDTTKVPKRGIKTKSVQPINALF